MTTDEKLAKLNARDFTYVSVTYFNAMHDLHFDHFIVLSGSLPVARQAADQIAPTRLPEGAELATELSKGRPISLYPKNYIREAKAMLKSNPEDVYAVESTTTVSVSA